MTQSEIHFKNIVAFLALMTGERRDFWYNTSPDYIMEKFVEFCMSPDPTEYKRGIHPILYEAIYNYFDKHEVGLDADEELAKKLADKDDVLYGVERRWPMEK